MPISTRWYDVEKRVITQIYEGSWTWEELNRESTLMHQMAKSVDYNVVLISDMTNTSFMPKGNVLSQGKSVIKKLPDNVTHVVIVIQSRLIEVFTTMVLDMMPGFRKRIKFVKTMEEGEKAVTVAVAANRAESAS